MKKTGNREKKLHGGVKQFAIWYDEYLCDCGVLVWQRQGQGMKACKACVKTAFNLKRRKNVTCSVSNGDGTGSPGRNAPQPRSVGGSGGSA